MDAQPGVSAKTIVPKPQERVSDRLSLASELRHTGRLSEAMSELETAIAEARTTPYEIEFQTRIQLGMALADVYLSADEIQKARAMLADEVIFAERISQIMNATGTLTQKRAATSGYLQVLDRATQVSLIGQVAPDISISKWINGESVSLSDLLGSVVLLEFWATWCKPCREMFPRMEEIHKNEAVRGLEIIGLTRHYLAYRGTVESMNEELELMRRTINEIGVSFRIGVAEDERLQKLYGANGLPTAVLIDRRGVVRYAGPGLDDRAFEETYQRCLAASD
jgi:thiol-disulfide isomerase/thioredoxin